MSRLSNNNNNNNNKLQIPMMTVTTICICVCCSSLDLSELAKAAKKKLMAVSLINMYCG